MKKLLSLLAAVTFGAATTNAANIYLQALADPDNGYGAIVSSANSLLPTGNLLVFGNDFLLGDLTDDGGMTPDELATMESTLDVFLSWTIGTDDGIGGIGNGEFFINQVGDLANFGNESAFLLVFNVATFGQISDATEFGVLQYTPGFPANADGAPNILWGLNDLSTVSGGGSFLAGSPQNFQMVGVAAIPEPGTWAMIAGAMLGAVAVRRRFRKKA